MSDSIESSLRSQGYTGTQTGAATLTTTLSNGQIVTATATAEADGGTLNGLASSSHLPGYAIALICVFGSLALLLALAGAYLVWRRWRRNQAVAAGGAGGLKDSMRSTSPMLNPNGDSAHSMSNESRSPVSLGPPVSPAHGADSAGMTTALLGAGGASSRARDTSSAAPQTGESQPQPTFWSDEASRMADAFRNALRQPSFAGSEDPTNGSTSHLLPVGAGVAAGAGAGAATMGPNPSGSSAKPSSIFTGSPATGADGLRSMPSPALASARQVSGAGSSLGPRGQTTEGMEHDGQSVIDNSGETSEELGTNQPISQRPTLAQLLQQELARDGMEMHDVGRSRPTFIEDED